MTGYSPDPEQEEERARRDASVWLTLLRSSRRSPALEADFRAWMDADVEHKKAFASVTRMWDLLGAAGEGVRVEKRRRGQRHAVVATALAACLAVAIGAWATMTPVQTFETRHGEQRTVLLDDGSRLALNTDTRVVVHYMLNKRSLRLDYGEAGFDVAHDRTRPFEVETPSGEVVAVGTSFTIRALKASDVSVTLVEGRVKLAPTAPAKTKTPVVFMRAGQRWSFAGGVRTLAPKEVAAANAWRRGEVIFNDASLADAVEEMNRYSASPIYLDVSGANDFKISGIFRFDDGMAFAQTLADIYGLSLQVRGQSIHILGRPQPPGGSQ